MSILYPYQKKLVKRNNRFEINVKSRQIGYSFAFAYVAAKRCMLENRDQLIVSASHRQSKRVMFYCDRFIRAFRKLPQLSGLTLETDTLTEKRFSSGKQILCLPSNPETIRGFPGDVFLDEFALYKNDAKIFEAILPSITRGYNLTISSTPLGKQNLFHEIYNDTKKYRDFKRYKINVYDAAKEGFRVDIDSIKQNFDEESFRQEYLCEFIDESTAYFTYDLLRKCIDDYEPARLKGPVYIGIDIGRTNDKTVIAAVSENPDSLALKRMEVLNNAPFGEQKETILQIISEEKPVSVFIDKGGIGMQLAEELEDRFDFAGGITWTNQLKNDAVTFTKKLMEENDFRFTDERELIGEFHSIQRTMTQGNHVKFESPRTKKGHGDRAWAVILALYAAKCGENGIKMAFI
jgi:phage FluMu gp28-like protein